MSRTKAENHPKRPPEARKRDKKNTANTQQVRFFKLYFDFNVFSAENRRLFLIEFQLHTNSHITLWLPVK